MTEQNQANEETTKPDRQVTHPGAPPAEQKPVEPKEGEKLPERPGSDDKTEEKVDQSQVP